MIKVSVMYPNTPSARFDHAYYMSKHIPLVRQRLGKHCESVTVERGLGGGVPGTPATYAVIANIVCKSVDDFQTGFGPHAQEIMGDIPNYTDLQPIIQINEMVPG